MRLPWLPTFSLTAVLLFGVAPSGCTKATVIGTTCKKDGDCNVKGEVCAPGFNSGPSICTRVCTANTGATGCPIGYDCFPTDPTKGLTCNKTLYEVDASGNPLLMGVDCSTSNDTCVNTGTTNAAPSCRRIPDPTSKPPTPVDFDPNAYCTGTCAGDYDCPLDMFCGTDYDMQKKCLRRSFCTPCTIDGNCPSDFSLCVPTADGTSHYCSKPCNSNGDCGGVQNTALTCSATTTANGTQGKACLQRYGACLGEGNICDPCQTDADCAKTKSSCFINSGTHEGFCTKRCTSDAACMSMAGKVLTACDNQHIGSASDPGGMSIGICNGDVMHNWVPAGGTAPEGGLQSCWLPQ